jgi:hypothetical protein
MVRRLWPTLRVAAVSGLSLFLGCRQSSPSGGQTDATSAIPDTAALPDTMVFLGRSKPLTVPKVPFGNLPCQSLTSADQQALGISGGPGKPDRAPAKLPIDNMCAYSGMTIIGYMTDKDYQFNQQGNQSTSRKAPGTLPGAFYDDQGGLWFAKNGYYVVVSGHDELKEAVARVVAGKL